MPTASIFDFRDRSLGRLLRDGDVNRFVEKARSANEFLMHGSDECKLGRHAISEKVYSSGTFKFPKSFQLHYALITELTHQNKFVAAIAACDRALELLPHNHNVSALKASILERVRRYDDARAIWHELIDTNALHYPGVERGHYVWWGKIIKSYIKERKFQEAVLYIENAIERFHGKEYRLIPELRTDIVELAKRMNPDNTPELLIRKVKGMLNPDALKH